MGSRQFGRLALCVGVSALWFLPGVSPASALPAFQPPVPPAVCSGSSLCNGANLPLLLESGSVGAATAPVATATAQTGGYLSTYGLGGLAGETAGGLGAVALSLLGVGAVHFWKSGSGSLPTRPYDGRGTLDVSGQLATNGTLGEQWVPSSGAIDWEGSAGQDKVLLTFRLTKASKPAEQNWSGSTSVKAERQCANSSTWTTVASFNFSTGANSQYWATCSASSPVHRIKVTFPGPDKVVQSVYLQLGPSSVDWDPDKRWIQQTVTCDLPGGGSVTSTVEGPKVAGIDDGWDVPAAGCPAGSTLSRVDTKLKTEGAADTDVGALTFPQPLRDVSTGSDPANPCYARPGAGDCVVGLQKIDGSTVTEDWWQNKNDYECTYGGALIPIEFCSIYRTKITPETVTVDAPVQNPDAPGVPVGAPVVNPTPNPTPTPTPTPGGGAAPADEPCPSLSGLTLKGILSGAVVFNSARCALAWAFIPDASAVTALKGQVSNAWSNSGPVQFTGQVSALVSVAGDGVSEAVNGGDCRGPVMRVEALDWHKDVYPISVCDRPMSTIAAAFKAIAGFFLIVGSAVVAARTIAKAFGLDMPGRVSDEA